MPEKKIVHNGSSVFVRIIGNGKPVVLIHGFGEDSNIWNHQIEYLKDHFLLIVPDLPGSGKSTMNDEEWTMEKFAEIIKIILDNESITKCTIIGHSMGGYITLAFAEKFPEYLNGFGLFHSTTYSDSEEKKTVRRKGIEFMKEFGGFEFLKTSVPNLFSPVSKDEMQDSINKFIHSLNNFKADALVSYYEAMMHRNDRTTLLKNQKFPILFIAGEYDNAVPFQDSLKQCHLPDLSYFHILEKSGHMGMMEEAEKSNHILEEYLINL
jgi:pimeloyl-ACP methyl ester carboxylesterase